MASMKDLEQRVQAIEERLDAQGDAAELPPGEPQPDYGKGGDLERRVARLENLTGHRLPDHADRIAQDKVLVARFANSRDEALAQEAARQRLADLGISMDTPQPPADDADDQDALAGDGDEQVDDAAEPAPEDDQRDQG